MIRSPPRAAPAAARKPRASGDDPRLPSGKGGSPTVNPARAGMIPDAQEKLRRARGKPRASGDDPDALEALRSTNS